MPRLADTQFDGFMAAIGGFGEHPHLAIAVSGGSDSMALLLASHRWAQANAAQISALTIDHGLRAEAKAEAAQVKAWCEALGIAHHTLTWAPPALASAIQEQARNARYRLLGDWCAANSATHLLTAHHRDDQLETLIFRLARGSGLDGLAGISRVSTLENGTRLLRPLLSVPKAALNDYLTEAGQTWLEDPSNQSPNYTRNRIRLLLAESGKLDELSERAGKITEVLGRFRSVLEAKMAEKLASTVRFNAHIDEALLDLPQFRALEPEYGLRVLAHVTQAIGGQHYKPRTQKLERFYEEIMQHKESKRRTLGGCIFQAQPKYKRLRIYPEN